jgi:hypothetical protein
MWWFVVSSPNLQNIPTIAGGLVRRIGAGEVDTVLHNINVRSWFGPTRRACITPHHTTPHHTTPHHTTPHHTTPHHTTPHHTHFLLRVFVATLCLCRQCVFLSLVMENGCCHKHRLSV